MTSTLNADAGESLDYRQWQALTPVFNKGPGARARLGVLVLTTDMSSEWDMTRFTRLDGVDCFVSRMPMALEANVENLTALKDEVVTATRNLVPWAQFDAIAFACTTGSIAVGPQELQQMVQSVKPGVPVRNPVDSAIDALAGLKCRKVALLTPYIGEVNATLEDYFIGRGLELTSKAAFNLAGDPQIDLVDPECIIDAGLDVGSGDCDGLFVSCTGLRTAGIVQRLEDKLGKPVVTSNQALAWATLRAAGIRDEVEGFGQLFRI